MRIEYKNSKNQMMEYYDYYLNHQTIMKKYRQYKIICGLPIGLILSIVVLLFRWELMRIHNTIYPEDTFYILLPTLIGIIWCALGLLLEKVIRKDNFESMLKNEIFIVDESINLTITESGIEYDRKNIQSIYYWKSIKKVIEYKDCLYIILINGKSLVIPGSAFDDNVAKDNFIDIIESKIE